MDDTLVCLDNFVIETLKPANLISAALSQNQIEDLIAFVTKEEKNIRKKIHSGYINAKTYKKYAKKISGYQKWIISLSNDLSKYFHCHKEHTELYDHCFIILEDLIAYLEEYFPEYFDYNQQIPIERKLSVIQNLKCQITDLQTLATTYEIDKEIITIITETVREYFYNSVERRITFNLQSYFQDLFQQLFDAIKYTSAPDKTWAVITALLYVNFNHSRVFTYIINYISKQTSTFTAKHLQIEKIYWFKKSIQQMPLGNPQNKLFPKMHLFNADLVKWLSDDLVDLGRTNQSSLIFPPATLKEEQLVEINLSVAQLSYALKVMIDTNTVINTNHKQLSELTVSACKTIGTPKISSESLRTKSNADAATKGKIKEVLIKMLNYVNKTA